MNLFLKKTIINSIKKAVIGVSIFIIAHFFFNHEFIRHNSTDFAFDIFNEYWFSEIIHNSDLNNNTKAIVYYIDDDYLDAKGLLNKHADKDSYGYLLPRKYIADFIANIDKKANTDGPPLALFLDFDVQYTSLAYNNSLSEDDVEFLTKLVEDRAYPIILVKNSTSNFIEQLSNKVNTKKEIELSKKIQNLINSQNYKKKIFFAETKFLKPASDNITRTYLPYSYYNNNIYYSFAVIGWQLSKNKKIDADEVFNDFNITKYKNKQSIYDGNAIIDSNVLLKDSKLYTKHIDKNTSYQYKKSNWLNLDFYSANAVNVENTNIANKIIMLGVDSSTNEDIFSVNADYVDDNKSSTNLSGVEMHANALMTILYLDGNLKQYDPYYGIIFVFIIFFLVDLTIQLRFRNYSNGFKFLLSLSTTGMIFLIFSLLLFTYQKVWFNWSFPLLFLYLEEVYEFVRRYLIERYKKKQGC